jgi:hypothetical protein
MIYSFEIDEDTWKSRGPAFLDSISGRNLNNLDEIMIKLLSQFNPKTLGEIGT